MNLHTHRLREPRLQRGAIPFRSSYRVTTHIRSRNFSASEQRAAAACNAGGDDPIRTDGAFQGHSALAVRCHRPLGHVSIIPWWGWRDLNSHAQRHWFLRPACLPFPPHPHDLLTSCNLDTPRVIRSPSTNLSTNWWASRDQNPEDVTALEAAASANSARSPQKKAPRFLEGLRRFRRFYLNQPHPSMPSKSPSDSDRYDLNRFFTETRIPQI